MLNPKELRVYKALRRSGQATFRQLAVECFRRQGVRGRQRGNSWVRNSMRRLLKYKLAVQVGRGTYEWTGLTLTACRKALQAELMKLAPDRPEGFGQGILVRVTRSGPEPTVTVGVGML